MNEERMEKILERLIEMLEPDCGEGEIVESEVILERLGLDTSRALLDGIYYPNAIKDFGGKMKFAGRYAKGFPVGAVVHFTAGRPNDGEDSTRLGIKDGLTYFVIGRTGKVYQNFSLEHWGHHAGFFTKHPLLGTDLSRHLVGIEVVAAGMVKKIDENTYRPYYNEEKPKPKDDFTKDQVRYREAIGTPDKPGHQKAGFYHVFTPEQEASLIDLLKWLKHAAPSVFKYDYVLGHDEIAVVKKGKYKGQYLRKNDPGAALSMPMSRLRQRLEEGVTYWVSTAAQTQE